MIRSSTFADFSIPAYTPGDTLVFCLAATINAENGIKFLLVNYFYFGRLLSCAIHERQQFT